MSLSVALEHYERGLALLPLRPKGKEPNFAVLTEVHGSQEWRPLAARRASPAEIRHWHEVDPETNLGVILGGPSGGLVVIDVDREPMGVAWPATPTVRTSRGRHVYVRSDEPVQTMTFPWGELRGEGSYVALPDSVHPSGIRYEYVVSPSEAEPIGLSDLEFPGTSHHHHKALGGLGPNPQEYQLPAYPSEDLVGELGCPIPRSW